MIMDTFVDTIINTINNNNNDNKTKKYCGSQESVTPRPISTGSNTFYKCSTNNSNGHCYGALPVAKSKAQCAEQKDAQKKKKKKEDYKCI